MPRFHQRWRAPDGVSGEDLWDWHGRKGAFQRLSPPGDGMALELHEGIGEGDRIRFRIRGPLGIPFVWEGVHHRPGGQVFVDEMVRGPFGSWSHRHEIGEEGGVGVLDDTIDWTLPVHPLGTAVAGWVVQAQLRRLFGHRHRVMTRDFRRHLEAKGRRLKIAVSGASGLVGTALCAFLETGGHEVRRLVRKAPQAGEIRWDPAAGTVDEGGLEGLDAVIHLAGAGIADSKWTPARKAEILGSRVDGTRTLVQAALRAKVPPKTFVSTSAIGFYGDRGDEVLHEGSAPGTGFLSEVCQAWEGELAPLAGSAVRSAVVRVGLVLSGDGASLGAQAPLYRAGLGGPIGGGAMWQSWISLDDLIGLFYHLVLRDDLSGIFSGSAPQPVIQRDFARALGKVLGRPAILPTPAFPLKLGLGEMASLVFDSARVEPRRTLESGFRFEDVEVESGIRSALGL